MSGFCVFLSLCYPRWKPAWTERGEGFLECAAEESFRTAEWGRAGFVSAIHATGMRGRALERVPQGGLTSGSA
jgi:hypothetical protein